MVSDNMKTIDYKLNSSGITGHKTIDVNCIHIDNCQNINCINSLDKFNRIPSYEERCQSAFKLAKDMTKNKINYLDVFVPRSITDFNDGGAFPEIHVAQYPRHMSNPNRNRTNYLQSQDLVSIKKDEDFHSYQFPREIMIRSSTIEPNGQMDYTSLITSGTNSDKKVFANYESMKPSSSSNEDLSIPSTREISDTVARTSLAIQSLLSSKITLSKPLGSALLCAETSKEREKKTEYIKYTANKDTPGYNPIAANRIIQLVPAQLDPMMPPKHKHYKTPRGPAEDPVPVLHSPPRKLTKEEKRSWNVPACISNWKNTRGYTIPLDKRLAADGRGLRDDTTVNGNFATLSESLYLAERQAREEVRVRALVQKRKADADRDRREMELRELAARARSERSATPMQLINVSDKLQSNISNINEKYALKGNPEKYELFTSAFNLENDNCNNKVSGDFINNDNKELIAKNRERFRIARRRELERDLRLEKLGNHVKNRKITEDTNQNESHTRNSRMKKPRKFEDDRDISEKIALGVHTGIAVANGSGGDFDTRLFNQVSGLNSGFGREDDYNTYTKPMFERDGLSSSIYRPNRGDNYLLNDVNMINLRPKCLNSSFQSLQDSSIDNLSRKKIYSSRSHHSTVSRDSPIQFEKINSKN